ncbi:MAG: hypothetical protein KatS3mg105_0926 [Gemmatales bacterium]|nr:MAG: hypothetical protein KatS3mg105_0926 [Gemmatales bacterium]
MAHGPSGDSAEPNLTPLLDVVLQLLMFFMMCVNFVSEQVNQNIKLPPAESAVPMDKTQAANSVMFLNIDRNGALVVPGHEPMKHLYEWDEYLRKSYEDAKNLDILNGGSGEVNTTIVIRADQHCDYGQVFTLMRKCKERGYKKLQIRAEILGAKKT